MTVARAGSPRPAATSAALLRATALIVLSACSFGSIPILVTLAMRSGATLLTTLTWRYVIGAALLALLAGGAGLLRVAPRRLVALLVIGGGGQAAVAYTSLYALRYLPAATVSFLFYTYPAWVAVIEAVRGTERLNARRATALALSIAGITLMVGSPWAEAMHPVGVLLALTSAVLYAAYIPTLGHLQQDVPSAVASVGISLGTIVVLVAASLAGAALASDPAARAVHPLPPPAAWWPIVLLGAVSTAFAFVAFLRALPVLGPVRTAITSTVEPFWTALLGAVVLGQGLRWSTLGGGVLIAAAVLLVATSRGARGEGRGN